jgi:hypothetical protein
VEPGVKCISCSYAGFVRQTISFNAVAVVGTEQVGRILYRGHDQSSQGFVRCTDVYSYEFFEDYVHAVT